MIPKKYLVKGNANFTQALHIQGFTEHLTPAFAGCSIKEGDGLNITYEPSDYQCFEDALPNVIKLLETAINILGNSVQMPLVEPDSPEWEMFWLRPYSDTAAHLFSQIFDIAEAAEKLMNRINADSSE